MKERIPLWRSDRQREHRADREGGDISLVSSRRSLLFSSLARHLSQTRDISGPSLGGCVTSGEDGQERVSSDEQRGGFLRGFSSGFVLRVEKGVESEPDRDVDICVKGFTRLSLFNQRSSLGVVRTRSLPSCPSAETRPTEVFLVTLTLIGRRRGRRDGKNSVH